MKHMDYQTPEEILVEVGRRLRRWRLDGRLSQARLAAKAGVSLTAVQALEAGRGSSQLTYVRVLKALGLLHTLDTLAPVPDVNPLDLLDLPAERQRAPRRKS